MDKKKGGKITNAQKWGKNHKWNGGNGEGEQITRKMWSNRSFVCVRAPRLAAALERPNRLAASIISFWCASRRRAAAASGEHCKGQTGSSVDGCAFGGAAATFWGERRRVTGGEQGVGWRTNWRIEDRNLGVDQLGNGSGLSDPQHMTSVLFLYFLILDINKVQNYIFILYY